MNATRITIIAAVLIVTGTFMFVLARKAPEGVQAAPVNNVVVTDGVQVIDLTAKGGYSPLESVAKAGIPTILRVSTQGTFDCSSALRIPEMDISRSLPASGVTEIDLGTPQPGKLQGTCSMGMYPFVINFTS